MSSVINRLRRDRSGAVALEFAVIAPSFLLMLLGTMEVSRYIFAQESLELLTGQVARAAVTGAITPACPATLPASIVIPPTLAPGSLTVCVVQSSPSGSNIEYQVTSSYNFIFVLPALSAAGGMMSAKTAPVF